MQGIEADSAEASKSEARGGRLVWPVALLVAAVWGTLAPFVGPSIGIHLDVRTSVEIVDHLLPGLVALAAAGVSLRRRLRGSDDDVLGLVLATAALFAGFFMAATHLTLVRQDFMLGVFPTEQVILHATPGLLILLIAAARFIRLMTIPTTSTEQTEKGSA